MIALLVLASSYGGLAALALAMQRYQAQVWRRRPAARARLALRMLGALGLVLSLLACVNEIGWAIGLVSWAGTLTAASWALSLALTYQSRLIAESAALAGLVSGALLTMVISIY